ncbi:cytochrome c553 [Tamilnaduibacter salinus]|nr:cytochrome c [Tamilnaduibacter salinus]PVY76294.1 cytochrome c553 [Tamilnaduibacter salinus]
MIGRYWIMPALVLLVGCEGRAMAGDVQAGREKAAVCASCHGHNGLAPIERYPNLAGQNRAYLVSALEAYRDGDRQGGQATLMQGPASNLSDEDIADLAAYYASLPADGGS